MAEAETPRLQMQAIAKSFGAARVLDDVAFLARPGEIVALLGSNGAGKSTLMKILTGVYARDGGSILVNGAEVQLTSPRDAARLGITFLPQEISVFPELSVAENICLSGQSRGAVDWAVMATRAGRVLDDLGFGHIRPDMRVGDLGVAEQRIVEIARALEGEAEILVMDEPTAALSEQESEQIFEILQRLRARGTAVVYISHYLKEVFRIADRIVVLRDGRNAGEFRPETAEVAQVVAAMLGQAAGHLFEDRPALSPDAPVLFTARGVSLPGKIADVSFELRQGEILGIFGLIGSGVEVLGRLLFGAEGRLRSGAMALDDRPYAPSSPRAARDAGVGFVTAERKSDGILADLSVAQNLVAPFQREFGQGAFLAPGRERAHASDWIARIGIRTSGPDQAIRLLSGGNQQKICVARWLTPKVRMLILEEPTRGVDVGARRELYVHLARFAREGLGILVLSSDVEEVAGLSDRSLVIDRGRITAEFARGATAGDLMASVAGDQATALNKVEVNR